jgi:hypothetical protein
MALTRIITGPFSETAIGDPNSDNVFEGYGYLYDTLLGGSQNDTFHVTTDRHVDFIDGGAGRDLVDFSWSGPLRIDLTTGAVSQQFWYYDWEADECYLDWGTAAVLTGVEDVRGTMFNDSILGNWFDNTIEGGYGADAINGAGGSDTASYEHSFAGVTVDLGGWSPFPGLGEIGYGSGGDAEGDVLVSIENVTGSSYADLFYGSAADNIFDGGAGIDRVSYRHATEGVTVDFRNDTVTGRSEGTDTLRDIELVEGSRFSDTYVGGSEVDTFVFGQDVGHDTIENFAASGNNHDVIRLEGWFDDWEDLRSHIEDTGNDVVIHLDDQNSITLTDVHYNDLGANDFIFI